MERTGNSERVRQIADHDFVHAARVHGGTLRIVFGDLLKRARAQGIPQHNAEQVATAIESRKFWEPRGLQMISPKGQPRRVDTVFEFRFVGETPSSSGPAPNLHPAKSAHDPLLALVGTLKHAFAEGAEAFIRDIRRDKEQQF